MAAITPVEGDVVLFPSFAIEEVILEPEKGYEKAAKEREILAEEARVEAGESGLEIGSSLRTTWMCAQRADSAWTKVIKELEARKSSEEFRLGTDGLLEKFVKNQAPIPAGWVPVAPAGHAAAHMTWARWSFLQAHIGVFGAHRSGPKTYELLSRIVFWTEMSRDVNEWARGCVTCVRFRQKPMKQEAVAVKAVSLDIWEEVMVDCEGPSNPPDAEGHQYTLTYLCLLSHAILLEPLRRLTVAEMRRAFARCIFRAGTLPLVLRSDRGPEFRNHLMKEFTALVGIRHRFGMAWRPCEQGAVERVHQEEQKLLGILLNDVMRAFGNEWTELLPVVEFLVYNTPGPHGLTPRDIDRRWSLALPLEKDCYHFKLLALNLFRTTQRLFLRPTGTFVR